MPHPSRTVFPLRATLFEGHADRRREPAEQRSVDARISDPLLGLDLAANTAITIARRSRQAGFGEPDWTAADNQNRNLDDITVCLVGAQ
jgi:hypothetical protein